MNQKINVPAAGLALFIRAAKKVTPKKSCIEILKNVAVDVTSDHFIFTAGDTNAAVIYTAPNTTGARPGHYIFMFSMFEAVAKTVKKTSDAVYFEVDPETLRLVSVAVDGVNLGGSACYDGTEYPHYLDTCTAMDTDGVHLVQIDDIRKNDVADLVSANKCASTDSMRLNLCGVAYGVGASTRSYCATDGHRAALHGPAFRISSNVFASSDAAILPHKFIGVLDTIKTGGTMAIYKGGAYDAVYARYSAHIVGGTIDAVSMCYEGPYPNINAVIPQYSSYAYEVNAAALVSAIDAVKFAANERTKQIVLSYDGRGSLRLTASDPDRDASSASLCDYAYRDDLAAKKECENFSISFNYAYLREIVSTYKGSVVLYHSTPLAASVIRPAIDPDNGTRFLLMPCRLPN